MIALKWFVIWAVYEMIINLLLEFDLDFIVDNLCFKCITFWTSVVYFSFEYNIETTLIYSSLFAFISFLYDKYLNN